MTNLLKLNRPRSEWEHLIDEWIIGANSERNRKLVKRRLLDGVRFEPLAEEFDLSVQRTKDIFYECVKTLSKHA